MIRELQLTTHNVRAPKSGNYSAFLSQLNNDWFLGRFMAMYCPFESCGYPRRWGERLAGRKVVKCACAYRASPVAFSMIDDRTLRIVTPG